MARLSSMHLFVYGTLRRSGEQPVHPLLAPASFVGPARFQGKLYDLGAYPAAVASDDPQDSVRGEVYLLHTPAATLEALDRYEGCDPSAAPPHEYARVATDVQLETGARPIISAQVYVYNRPVDLSPRISTGDWLAPDLSRSR